MVDVPGWFLSKPKRSLASLNQLKQAALHINPWDEEKYDKSGQNLVRNLNPTSTKHETGWWAERFITLFHAEYKSGNMFADMTKTKVPPSYFIFTAFTIFITASVLMCRININTQRNSCLPSLHLFCVVQLHWSVKGGPGQRGQSSIEFCEQSLYGCQGLVHCVELSSILQILHRALSNTSEPSEALKGSVWVYPEPKRAQVMVKAPDQAF